jgi:hypothetical protein
MTIPMVRMGPRESRGWLLGLRVPQLLLILTALGSLALSVQSGNGPQIMLGLGSAAVLGAVALVPIRGRQLDEYVPVVGNLLVQRWNGEHVYRGGVFRADQPGPRLRLPGTLAHLDILEFDAGGGELIGVAKDPRAGTYTAVLECRGLTFPLLDSATKARYLTGFGQMLAATCTGTTVIERLQILERTEPDTGESLARDYSTHGARDGGFADQSYSQLMASISQVQQTHESYVVIVVSARKADREIRQAGGGEAGAAAVVYREAQRVKDGLKEAGVEVLGLCSPRGLGEVLRNAYDPGSRAVRSRRGGGQGDDRGGDPGLPSGVAPAAAGPMRAENHWGYYRTDSAFHRSWWAAELPRSAVPAGFLFPLLLTTSCRRAVSLVFEPVSPRTAQRKLNSRAANVMSEQTLRDRMQRRTTRRAQVEAQDLSRREDELVAGHAMPRVIVLISTSASSLDELEDASNEIERLSQQAFLEVVRLVGEHDQGFAAAALPLGQGLR